MNNKIIPMAIYVDVFLAVMAVHLAAQFLTPTYLLASYSVLIVMRLMIAYHFES